MQDKFKVLKAALTQLEKVIYVEGSIEDFTLKKLMKTNEKVKIFHTHTQKSKQIMICEIPFQFRKKVSET